MPPGRPKKYLTDEARCEARKAQVRNCVKAYRVRKALLKKSEAKDSAASLSSAQISPSVLTEIVDVDEVDIHPTTEDTTPSAIDVSTLELDGDYESKLAALVASAYDARNNKSALNQTPSPLQVVSLDYVNLDPIFPGDSDERRLFHYFRTRGIEEMIMFESDFWSYSLLQAAYVEPAVKHAILTLASLHETFTEIPNDQSGAAVASARRSNWAAFGMTHYNKALRQLTQLNDVDVPSSSLCIARLPATLVCSILFAVIDTLLGNEETALMHIRHAFRMLPAQHSPSISIPSSGSDGSDIGVSEQQSYDVWSSENTGHYVSYDQLYEVLQTLDVCSKSWLVSRSLEDSRISCNLSDSSSFVQLILSEPFNSLSDARKSFELIFSSYWSIMGGFDTSLLRKGYSLPFEARCTIFTAADTWWRAFESLYSRLQWTGRVITAKQSLAILTMKVHMTIISISTEAGTAGDAIPTEFNEQLRNILDMSRVIVLSRRTYCTNDLPQTTFQLGPRTFRIGLGVIPALYWVAALCEDEFIRQESYDILKMVSRGEVPLPHYASDVKE